MKKKTSLKVAMKKRVKKKLRRREPLWKGPEIDGITQSMISGFLECRERFRLRNIVGLQEVDTFNHRIEYGQMWHVCEEGFACEVASREGGAIDCAFGGLENYARKLCKKYPLAQEQINHWYQVCKTQFWIYIKYWAKHKSMRQRTSLLQEEVFNVPYKLPSGRVVKLRGKWDGVSLEKEKKNAAIYLDENKTKGDIKEEQLKRQLQFDIQTMFYLVALDQEACTSQPNSFLPEVYPIRGIRYNVVRRPLSGGKGSIKQLKPTKKNPQGESAADFYSRLGAIIAEEPEHFFMRWEVEVTPDDMERFRREFLDPILEQICDWYEWIAYAHRNQIEPFDDPGKHTPVRLDGLLSRHFRTPYGCWNSLARGYTTELDEYLATGSTLGLEYTDRLFKELE